MLKFTSSIFFWSIINFLILFFVVYKFAFPPLFKILEEREKKRLEIMEEIKNNQEESKKLYIEYQAQLSNINNEARQILKEAREEKEKIKKETQEEALKEKQRVLTSIKEELVIEKKLFIEEMRLNAVNLVVNCSEQILKKELNPKDHDTIFKENILELQKVLKV
ncbi:MAG: F0F1 ATP synthase subunit B [Candidatus Margulisiibacteriota bacterium]|jgi:F-type H+-transporting ATPase subunit b